MNKKCIFRYYIHPSHPYIHPLSTPLICQGRGMLEPIPADFVREDSYTLDRLALCLRAKHRNEQPFMLAFTQGQFRVCNWPNLHLLGSVWMKNHPGMGRILQTLSRKTPVSQQVRAQSLFLWCDSATTVPPTNRILLFTSSFLPNRQPRPSY